MSNSSSATVAASTLRVSITVSTRNRPEHAAACVATLLEARGFFELVVVDQSDGDATERALAPLGDPRLRYHRSALRGVTHGRNTGIDLTSGELVAFTDDDCRAAPDWAERLQAIFAADPAVALVCGRVVVPAELRARGYAEAFEPQQREWQGRYPPLGSDWGITANMAARRAALERVGCFDPYLGVGGPLRSGGEPDLIFRVLRAGLKVVNAEEVCVEHLGVRQPGEETRKLWRNYAAGTGAAMFKHVRAGDPAGIALYLRFLGASLGRIGERLLTGKRPTGLGYLGDFLSGSLDSYRFRVDRARSMYAER